MPPQCKRPLWRVPYLPASCFALHLVRFSDEIEGGREVPKKGNIVFLLSVAAKMFPSQRASCTNRPTDVHVPPISRSNITCASDTFGKGCVKLAGSWTCILRNFPQRYLSHNLSRSTAEQMTQNEWRWNQLFYILSPCHSMNTTISKQNQRNIFNQQ